MQQYNPGLRVGKLVGSYGLPLVQSVDIAYWLRSSAFAVQWIEVLGCVTAVPSDTVPAVLLCPLRLHAASRGIGMQLSRKLSCGPKNQQQAGVMLWALGCQMLVGKNLDDTVTDVTRTIPLLHTNGLVLDHAFRFDAAADGKNYEVLAGNVNPTVAAGLMVVDSVYYRLRYALQWQAHYTREDITSPKNIYWPRITIADVGTTEYSLRNLILLAEADDELGPACDGLLGCTDWGQQNNEHWNGVVERWGHHGGGAGLRAGNSLHRWRPFLLRGGSDRNGEGKPKGKLKESETEQESAEDRQLRGVPRQNVVSQDRPVPARQSLDQGEPVVDEESAVQAVSLLVFSGDFDRLGLGNRTAPQARGRALRRPPPLPASRGRPLISTHPSPQALGTITRSRGDLTAKKERKPTGGWHDRLPGPKTGAKR